MPMRFKSWDAFAEHLDGVALRLAAAPREAAFRTAPLLAVAVKEIFGHDPPLKTLADSTQAERLRQGYTANNPLVRSGALRDTVEYEAEGNIAATGSADFLAPIHEYGNIAEGYHIPPRPAFKLGFEAAYETAQKIWLDIIGRAIGKI